MMNLANFIDLVTGIAVLIGLVFAALEVRHFRQSRDREAAIRLFETLQRTDVSKGTDLLFTLPDQEFGIQELQSLQKEERAYLSVLGTAIEGLGILVKDRELELAQVEDYFSGTIVLFWKRMRKYYLEVRMATGRDTLGEFIQWLAERIEIKESVNPAVPAYLEFSDWQEG